MTDTKDPPPAYQASLPLTTTSHGVTLSVDPRGPLYPGSELSITLSVPPETVSSAVGDAECTIEGTSTFELMGKKRFQTGMMINATLGPSGGAMVTSREHHTFASVSSTIPLRSSGDSPAPSSKGKVKGDDQGVEHIVRIPEERTCDCPGPRSEGVLPSFGAAGDHSDESSVVWSLTVVIKRKGRLKRDIKLSLSIPVSLPPLPAPTHTLSNTNSIPFAYDTASPSTPAPGLRATLTLCPPFTPGQIPFRLSLRAPAHLLPASSALPPSTSGFDIAVALSRSAWTKGIHQASFDGPEGFSWAGRRTGTISLAAVLKGGQNAARSGEIHLVQDRGGERSKVSGEGEMVFEGVYEHPTENQTIRGCGLAIDWTLHAHITWQRLTSTLSVEIPLVLPLVSG